MSLSIFIPTCSRYLPLCNILVPKIKEHIIDFSDNLPIYVSTDVCLQEQTCFRDKNVNLLEYGSTKVSWTCLNNENLKKVESEYVLIWLDDLIPVNSFFSCGELINLVDLMDFYSLDYLRLSTFFNRTASKKGLDGLSEYISNLLLKNALAIYALPSESDYRFSLIPSIWRRKSLIDLLEYNPNKTAWELEKVPSYPTVKPYKMASVSTSLIGTHNLVVKGRLWKSKYLTDLQLSNKLSDFRRLSRLQSFIFSINLMKHKLYLLLVYLPSLLLNSRELLLSD